MRRIKDRNLVPPDDFRYTDPDTGYTSHSTIYDDWVSRAKDHRGANNLAVPADLEALMNEQLCGIIPPAYCERDAGDVTWIDTKFSWNDFTEGMKIFTQWGLEGAPVVEEKEANRRGAICATCPLNVNVAGCVSCRKAASYITGAVAAKKGAHDSQLKACAVCKCSLQAMQWFPIALLMTNETPDRQAIRPDFCWVKGGGQNYEASA